MNPTGEPLMNVELPNITFPTETYLKIEVSVSAQINVTGTTAQRKVSKLLLDRVGNLLYGETPSLVAGERILWRVPVWLSSPRTGPMGQVGVIDVDVQTGEMLFSQELLDGIAAHGRALAEDYKHEI
jgi:hypothetical protein